MIDIEKISTQIEGVWTPGGAAPGRWGVINSVPAVIPAHSAHFAPAARGTLHTLRTLITLVAPARLILPNADNRHPWRPRSSCANTLPPLTPQVQTFYGCRNCIGVTRGGASS